MSRRASYPALLWACAGFLSTAGLAGCGGIEGTGSPQAGIEGTGVTDGTLTAIGSVFVNGVEYDTSRAQILMDGEPASEALFQVGMVLNVVGTVAADGRHGTAERVEFDRALFGPIDALDPDTRSLTVLGQRVQLDNGTVFAGIAEDALDGGDLCLVSGHDDGVGGRLATRLQCNGNYMPGGTVVEAEGVLQQLEAGRFRIGNLTVDYSFAQLDTGAGALADGAWVEARGVQPARRGPLQAQRVRVKSLALPAGRPVRLEGVISRFDSPADFELGGRRVDASGAQRTDNTAATAGPGVRILLQGQAGPDGRIIAERYALQPPVEILLNGEVDAVNAPASQLTLFGIAQQALAVTQYEDNSQTGLRAFGLDDLRPGEFVEARGYRDRDGAPQVVRIERRDPEEAGGGRLGDLLRRILAAFAADVYGPVDSVDTVRGELVIAGVRVTTNPADTEFFDRDGNALTYAQFFTAVQPGDRLYAQGSESDDVIEADSIRYAR